MDFKAARSFLLQSLEPRGYTPGKVDTDRSFILVAQDGSYVGLSDMQSCIQITFVNCHCLFDLTLLDENLRVVEEIDGDESILKESQ